MANQNKRTYINADEELIVQGKLVIEGDIEQKQYTSTVVFDTTTFEGETLIVNSDGFDPQGVETAATLSLRRGDAFGNISIDANSKVVFNTGIVATTIEGDFAGTASFAENLSAPVTVAVTSSDLTGTLSDTFTGEADNSADLTLNLVNTGVIANTYGNQSNAVTISVDQKGRITSAIDRAISITSSQVTDFATTSNTLFDTRLATKTTDNLAEGNNLYYTQTRFNSAFSNKSTTDLTEGSNLYYTNTRADARVDLQTGANLDLSSKTTAELSEDTNLYYTNARADARVDLQTGANLDLSSKDTGDLSEGTNLYYTQGRFDSAFTAKSTTNLTEGTNLYFTTARARGAISVTDNGGDGSLTYNSTTGVITYTGPSASEVRAHFSGNDGITLTNGGIAVDSTVVRTSGTQSIAGSKTFSGTVDMSGTITVPTQAQTDDSTKAASTAYVRTAVANLIDNAPAALDTLNELADALNDDATIGGIVSNNTTRISTIESRNVNAGAGLTGGGNLSADRTFNVGAGTGITVSADTVAVDMNAFDTDDLSEGSNLYYTQARFDSAFTAKSTTNLSEGDNLYYTQARFNSAFTAKSTTDLSEGTNLYYTNARADARVDLQTGANLDLSSKSTTDLSEGTNKYFTNARARSSLSGSTGISYNSTTGAISIDTNSVVRTSTDQTITGTKTFSTALVIPNTTSAANGAIYHDGIDFYGVVGGNEVKLSPTSDVGEVEDVGTSGFNIYAGARPVTVGNSTVQYHGIKSIDFGDYMSASETGNVITASANISSIREAFSASGDLSYNSGTGQFSFTQRSDSQVRGLISGTGIISYNSTTGAISSTADNYGHWVARSDSGTNEQITAQETVSFQGGTGISVTNSGNVFTIASTNSADITSVTAGNGLTGGGNTGALTLNVGSGTGITVSADAIAVDMSAFDTDNLSEGTNKYYTDARARGALSGGGDISYNSTTGQFSVTTYKSADFNTDFGTKSTTDLSEGTNLYFTTARANTAIDNKVNKTFVDGLGINASTLGGQSGSYYRNASNINAGTLSNARLPDLTVADFAGAAIQTGSESFVDSDTALMTAAAVNDLILSKGYITSQSDNQTLSWNGTTGVLSISGGNSVNLDGRYQPAGTYDNYGQWNIAASGTAGTSAITSGNTVTFTGTGATTVTRSGDNITINSTDTNTDTTYTAGTDLSLSGTQFNVDSATLATADTLVKRDSQGGVTSADLGLTGTLPRITLTKTGTSASTNYIGWNGAGLFYSVDPFGDVDNSNHRFLVDGSEIVDINENGVTVTGSVTATSFTGNATSATQAYVTEDNNNVSLQRLVFHGGDGSGNKALRHDDDLTYTPSTNTLTAGTFSDGTATMTGGAFSGVSASAKYADLAEKYATDVDYEPGTVVVFGGDAEVTVTDKVENTAVAGVISTDPAYMMNSEADGQYVALRGRVPCKVIGPVKKGDVLVTSNTPGYAMASLNPHMVPAASIVGKAISNKDDDAPGIVEILV